MTKARLKQLVEDKTTTKKRHHGAEQYLHINCIKDNILKTERKCKGEVFYMPVEM